jgi:hypothetical protein
MVTGLFLIDGGRLYDEYGMVGPNRVTLYRTSMLPSFGLVLQGLESRLNVTGFNYYANMSRDVTTGLSPIFTDRPVTFVERGALTEVTGDRTPVLIMNWVTGDLEDEAFYRLQFRAEVSGDPSRVEFFPIIDIGVIPEV